MVAVPPPLPPYAHITKEASQCIAQASVRYGVPQLLMHAVLAREGGTTGQCVRNKNGTYDCGLAQINSSWLPYFAKFGVTPNQVVYDACMNVNLEAYILKLNYLEKRNWFYAVVAYNIGPKNWTPQRYAIGYRYAKGVYGYWYRLQDWYNRYMAPRVPQEVALGK